MYITNRSNSNEDNGSDLLSSGMLNSEYLYLVTDVSEQLSILIFKVQALFLERLTLRDETICWSAPRAANWHKTHAIYEVPLV
jgi:hypothetical protein